MLNTRPAPPPLPSHWWPAPIRSWLIRRRWRVTTRRAAWNTAMVVEVLDWGWRRQRLAAKQAGDSVTWNALGQVWCDVYQSAPFLHVPTDEHWQAWLEQTEARWVQWWKAWASPMNLHHSAKGGYHPVISLELQLAPSLLSSTPTTQAVRDRVLSLWKSHPEIMDDLNAGRVWERVLYSAWFEALWRQAQERNPEWMATHRHALLDTLSWNRPAHAPLSHPAWLSAWSENFPELLDALWTRVQKDGILDTNGLARRHPLLLWAWQNIPAPLWGNEMSGERFRWERLFEQVDALPPDSPHHALASSLRSIWWQQMLSATTEAPKRSRL